MSLSGPRALCGLLGYGWDWTLLWAASTCPRSDCLWRVYGSVPHCTLSGPLPPSSPGPISFHLWRCGSCWTWLPLSLFNALLGLILPPVFPITFIIFFPLSMSSCLCFIISCHIFISIPFSHPGLSSPMLVAILLSLSDLSVVVHPAALLSSGNILKTLREGRQDSS